MCVFSVYVHVVERILSNRNRPCAWPNIILICQHVLPSTHKPTRKHNFSGERLKAKNSFGQNGENLEREKQLV